MKIIKRIKRKFASPKTRPLISSSGLANLPPLRFHPVHGEHVRIAPDGQSARRVDSFCKGIAFGSRPVRVNEAISIRFVELSSSWSGALRFGFTSNDPASLRQSGLPKYACPDLTNKSGYWAKALGERFATSEAILTYYVNEDGDVKYSVDGVDKGIFFSGVSTSAGKLWPLLDIYGNTTCVELLDSRRQFNNNINRTVSTSASVALSNGGGNNAEVELLPQLASMSISGQTAHPEPTPQCYSSAALSPMPFHRTRGCNVRLSNDRLVAERSDSHYCQGYTFTGRPLKAGEKLVLQVLQTDELYAGSLAFGLTTCDPSNLNASDLPEDPHQLLDRPEYWVVIKDVASGPLPGDELAFKVTETGRVLMIKNREAPVTLVHIDPSQKFYAFFDLYGSTIKVKNLGTVTESNVSRHANGHRRVVATANCNASTDDLASVQVRDCSENSSNYARVGDLAAATATRQQQQQQQQPQQQAQQTLVYVPVPAHFTTPLNVHISQGHYEVIGPRPTATATIVGSGLLQQANIVTPPMKTKQLSPAYSTLSSVRSSARSLASSRSNGSTYSVGNECTVCYEKPINSVLYMCGHMCMCYDCSVRQWKGQGGGQCPICRATILDVIKTYWS